ncbi:hypothetical protein [Pseudomonas sp. CF161]|uniref:hypothetical protein n=1 Tax=Pseudomonas sp. CF161 TaxID=911241 RepID=UPI000354FF4B|nr:hypothetical protein [Pseudomonas sp. CF161]EPL10758.1 tail tape measure protein [Pseudomonas sp. CF161]
MADTQTVEKKSVLLSGIDELSPKLASLQGKVDTFKKNLEQTGLGKLDISGLFKGGSLMTPFVEGIKACDAFKGKLAEVGDSASGTDMPGAAQNMNVFSQSMGKVSAAIDAALLPAVGALVVGLEPMLNSVGSLLNDNPALVEGLAAGAIAFSAMQTAVTGATQVFGLMSTVLSASPVMLIAMGIALAAGVIVANWTPISAFFVSLWEGVKSAAATAMDVLSTVFSWTPLGMVINNWGSITAFFSSLWNGVKALAGSVVDFLKAVFSWSPLGLVMDNWGGLTGLFSAIWDLLKALAVPVMGVLKSLFDWSPLVMLYNNWGAVTGFFSSIWAALQPGVDAVKKVFQTLFDFSPLVMLYNNWGAVTGFFSSIWAALQPGVQFVKKGLETLFDFNPLVMLYNNWGAVTEFFSSIWAALQPGVEAVKNVFQTLFDFSPLVMLYDNWGAVTDFFSSLWDKLRPTFESIKQAFATLFEGGFGGLIATVTGKVEGLTEAQRTINAAGNGLASMQGGALTQNSSALIQQTAANNRTQLEGGLMVSFANAPAGLRVDQAQTNQPGLTVASTVGYRSLSLGGSNV